MIKIVHSVILSYYQIVVSSPRVALSLPLPLPRPPAFRQPPPLASAHCSFLSSHTMFEASRRKVLGAMNSKYIYGRVVRTVVHTGHPLASLRSLFVSSTDLVFPQPLLHTIIFIVEIALTMRLIAKFNSYYAEKPILTTMITNAVSATHYTHQTP